MNVEITKSTNFFPPFAPILLVLLPSEANRTDIVLNLIDIFVSEIKLE